LAKPPKSFEQQVKEHICDQVKLTADGTDQFIVDTPFTHDDGDGLSIVLKKDREGWFLTDEGSSLMHLTYEVSEGELAAGARREILDRALSLFSVQNRGGELRKRIAGSEYGEALYSFVHALLRIDDIRLLSRQRSKSSFLLAFQHFVETTVPHDRRERQWHDPEHDQNGRYIVDYRIEGRAKPLYLFALPTSDRTNVAALSIVQLEKWGHRFDPVAVYENEGVISRKARSRLADVCPTRFPSLDIAEARLPETLALAG
jgi:hypothetical protein